MTSPILGLIVLILDIWALLSIWKSAEEVPIKIIWTIVILVLPVIGFIIWYFMGPKGT